MPMVSAIGNTTGISTTAAGRPSSSMPNRQLIVAVPIRNSHGWVFSGPSIWPSSCGTPLTPIKY